jgi:peptide/nickel transport system substrate-binding protein
VTFHTGRPFTAQAAKAAIERNMKLGQGAAYEWGAVSSIDAPDDYTLVFHLSSPSPLDLIASSQSQAYMYDTNAAGSGDLPGWFGAGHDAGTGPYTVDSWHRGQEVELILKSYPKYWDGWTGSHFHRVVYRVVPAATTDAQLLRAGQVSWVEQMTPQLWDSFKGDSNVRLMATPSMQNMFAMLNTQRAPLDDVRVRQAIAYGIDYEGMVKVLHGGIVRSSGIVPPGLWGHFDNLPNNPKYDPQKATALLNQAGYGPGGKPISLTLTYIVGDNNEQLASTIIKSSLAPLNVTVNLEALQWTVLWDKTKSSDPSQRQDIAIYEWYPDYADPFSWFTGMFSTQNPPFFNASYYSNPAIDKMMNDAESISGYDRPKAIDMYKQMQVTLMNDMPAVPLCNLVYQIAMASSFSGFKQNVLYPNAVFVYYLTP